VFPFGVFVRVDSKTTTYIRRRELTLSGNIDPRNVVAVGDELTGIVIEPATGDRLAELSVRALVEDPWPEFLRTHRVGDPIRVTVKHVFADGVLVEHVPGIDGFIPLDQLSTDSDIDDPDQVIWVGDRTEAQILTLDRSRKRMKLSIKSWLERLALIEPLMERLQGEGEPGDDRPTAEVVDESLVEPWGKIAVADAILIVDDDDGIRDQLVVWLNSFGCKAVGAASVAAASQEHSSRTWALIIVDIDMPEENGLSFISKLRAIDADVPIAVMSDPELIAKYLPQLVENDVLDVFPKPLELDDIKVFISDLAQGNAPKLRGDADQFASSMKAIENGGLAGNVRKGRDLITRFSKPTEQLAQRLKADKVAVFHLAPDSKSVSIVVEAGAQDIDKRQLHLLLGSPVKDVIAESQVIVNLRVSTHRTEQFRMLLKSLAFESVVGIPLRAGGKTEYALFVFARRSNAFDSDAVQYANMVAGLLELALESQLLADRVSRTNRVQLTGELASAFGHEVYNRVTALELYMKNARRTLTKVAADVEEDKRSEELPTLEKRVSGAYDTVADLVDTVRDFQQLLRPDIETTVDVNEVVLVAARRVEPLAKRLEVSVRHELADDLPQIVASHIRLQQVLLNLLLNAVQHTTGRPDGRRVVRATTGLVQEEGEAFLEIRVFDTGQGIHRSLWERVFEFGYTTRDAGSGLGLFIASSVVESLTGQICVEDSLIQIGTTFLVRLPVMVPTPAA
jgi:signal transduction histidine kinase/ActR/RegA family two-component response regulator/predicted RNA-binding protein with RPS1 domain